MVFFYFGPTPDSWALGNDGFSQCKNLPQPLQEVWDRLAAVQGNPAKAGCEIGWLSASPDGNSYAIMTKGGELLSNCREILAASKPASAVEYVSFAPNGGWLIRFTDGKVQYRGFPLVADLTDCTGEKQHSIVRNVFFGACNSRVINTEQGILAEGVCDLVRESLDKFGTAADMRSVGVLLGRATTLCPRDPTYHFVEEQSVKGRLSKYWYNLPPDEVPREVVERLFGNEDVRGGCHAMPSSRLSMCGLEMAQPPPAYQATPPPSPLHIPPTNREEYKRRFREMCGGRSHITGVEFAMTLMEAGLSKREAGDIWERSDLDKDGLLHVEEFVRAMWLANLHAGKHGRGRSKSDSLHPPVPRDGVQPWIHENQRRSFDAPLPFPQPSQPQLPSGSSLQPTVGTVSGAVPASPEQMPGVYRLSDGNMAMAKPVICRSCKKGIAPGDPAYYCETCGESLCFCMDCHGLGSSCPHTAPFVTFVPSSWLREKKPTECARCWGSIKNGSMMWHCDKCFDPARCVKCWHKGKYCKHVELGKVSLYRVSKNGSSQTGQYVEGAIEMAAAIFGF